MKRGKNVYLITLILLITVFVGTSLVFAGTGELRALVADFKFYINGQNEELSEQAVVINGKTYLPVRAFGEVVGKRVGWDEKTRTVIIDELLPDGEYKAANQDFNEHGWKSMVTVNIVEGKIDSVKYDEINAEGVYKSTVKEYLEEYKQVTKTDLLQNYKLLQTSLVNTQNIDMVDTVSGATHATSTFKELVKEALQMTTNKDQE